MRLQGGQVKPQRDEGHPIPRQHRTRTKHSSSFAFALSFWCELIVAPNKHDMPVRIPSKKLQHKTDTSTGNHEQYNCYYDAIL